MMRWIHAVMLASAVLAAGCSSTGSKELPPAELGKFTEEVELQKQWSRSIGEGQGETWNQLELAAEGDTLFAADVEGLVVAMNRESGTVLWERELDKPVSGGVGVGYGLVLVGTLRGQVIALDSVNGEVKWRAAVGSEVLAAPASNGDVVVVQTQNRKLGIVVDQVRGREEVVVKPLPQSLRGLSGLAAATITGDGNLALILDIDGLLKAV